MCDPLTLTGLALSAVGTGAGIYAKNEQEQAFEDRQDNILAAQREFQENSDERRQEKLGTILQETAGRENVEEQQAEEAAARKEAQTSNRDTVTDAEKGFSEDSEAGQGAKLIQQSFDEQNAANNEALDAEADANARLASLGDTLQEFGIFRQPLTADIEAERSKAQGQADLLPAQLRAAQQEAQNTARGIETFGQVASGLGTAATGAGAFAGAAGSGASAGANAAGGVGSVGDTSFSLFGDALGEGAVGSLSNAGTQTFNGASQLASPATVAAQGANSGGFLSGLSNSLQETGGGLGSLLSSQDIFGSGNQRGSRRQRRSNPFQ